MTGGKPYRIVVLDDDPTGIQTVHGCLLLTRWEEPLLAEAMRDRNPFFYVLTNSRACQPARVRVMIRQIVENALRAAEPLGVEPVFLSRSDSTLRSHFPLEVQTVRSVLRERGRPEPDALFLCPAFFEGGRLTAGDTHYLTEGERRIPTADSEFARDPLFGYSTSYLPGYIEEKSAGAVPAGRVRSVPLGWLRGAGSDELDRFLASLGGGQWVVVNAESYDDLNRFALSLRRALQSGKRFLFQSAASLVKSLAALPDRPPVGREVLRRAGPGMVVVGSHVARTTRQLEALLRAPGTMGIEVRPQAVLARTHREGERIRSLLGRAARSGRTPVAYTSRSLLRLGSAGAQRQAGQRLASFLAALVGELPQAPSFLIAKGGITAHVVLVEGLRIGKARVLGQVLPGVPAILTPPDHPFPSMPYVIFPGNVGGEDALRQAYATFAP